MSAPLDEQLAFYTEFQQFHGIYLTSLLGLVRASKEELEQMRKKAAEARDRYATAVGSYTAKSLCLEKSQELAQIEAISLHSPVKRNH